MICLLFSPTSEEGDFVSFSDKTQRLICLIPKIKKGRCLLKCLLLYLGAQEKEMAEAAAGP